MKTTRTQRSTRTVRPELALETLQRIARLAMLENGFLVAQRPAAVRQLAEITGPASDSHARDLCYLPWCSIDNDDSYDLDQLSAAIAMTDNAARLWVAIADVDALVPKDSPIDLQAQHNTASVYTTAKIYPMLPERLSTDLTSLNPGADRLAVVVDMTLDAEGNLTDSKVYRALVHNRCQLSYDAVAAWLDGTGPKPPGIADVPDLEAAIRLQDELAQRLRARRRRAGALDFESIETKPVFDGSVLMNLVVDESNRAKEIIEEFMIASNGVIARYLASKSFPSIRRVVRVPKRWDRIVALAAEYGIELPAQPNSRALNKFLAAEKKSDPLRFPDLSLNVIKLMGAGEYAVETPSHKASGHFGLAVRDYAHSTAPNRRYPDLITQRLIKAAVAGHPVPYQRTTLENIAQRCTEMEEAARKVERFVEKSAAAALLRERVGESFDALVTGASDSGVWVRLIDPPVEGRLSRDRGAFGESNWLEVGQQIRVKLINANVERGFVDFQQVALQRRTHRPPDAGSGMPTPSRRKPKITKTGRRQDAGRGGPKATKRAGKKPGAKKAAAKKTGTRKKQ